MNCERCGKDVNNDTFWGPMVWATVSGDPGTRLTCTITGTLRLGHEIAEDALWDEYMAMLKDLETDQSPGTA